MAAIPPALPRLAQVLGDRSIEPLSPAQLLPVEGREALVATWDAARKGALVGTHRSPDEDALFSVLTVVRELMGYLPEGPDDAVQLTFGDGQVPEHLQPWLENVYVDPSSAGPVRPVTVAVDCALPSRLMGLWGGLPISDVLILDHHDMAPTRESLQVNPSAEFALWDDPSADAACVLAAALATYIGERDGRPMSVQAAEWSLRGIVWDTHDFQNPGTKDVTLQVAKFLAQQLPANRLRSVLHDIEGAMPATAVSPAQLHHLKLEGMDVLEGRGLLLGCDIGCARRTQLESPEHPSFEAVHRYALDELDHCWSTQPERELCVLITQNRPSEFAVSFRSRAGTDLAMRLARSPELGGGGHAHRAGAQVKATSYAVLKSLVLRLMDEQMRG